MRGKWVFPQGETGVARKTGVPGRRKFVCNIELARSRAEDGCSPDEGN